MKVSKMAADQDRKASTSYVTNHGFNLFLML